MLFHKVSSWIMFFIMVLLLLAAGPAPASAQASAKVRAIAAGCQHSLALTSDGSVWEWGAVLPDYDTYLGAAAYTDGYAAPTRVIGLGSVVAIAAGCAHNLAVREDGTVWAWGSNGHGQLGDGTTTSRWTPVQVKGLTGVVAVSGGVDRSLALKSDGTVWRWGGPSYLPPGAPTPVPVQVTGVTGVMSIASDSLALRGDGTVWALGYDATTGGNLNPVLVSGLSRVISIAATYWHSMALKDDGTVWAWSWNQPSPAQVGGISDVVRIAGGFEEFAVKRDGTVWAWRVSATTGERSTPAQVSGLSEVASVACGWEHTLALKGDGTLWAWGSNKSRQLGDGSIPQRLTPALVSGPSGMVAAAAGEAHSVALKADGSVWAWGANQAGQLGDGTLADRWVPGLVSGLSGIVAIAAGDQHNLALQGNGTVWAWGSNTIGQLGDGTTTDGSPPVQVSGLARVVAIAASGSQSLALTRDGGVWQWGLNVDSPWGNGPGWEHWSTPVQVSGLGEVAAIAAGGWRGLALKVDGTVWTWGVGNQETPYPRDKALAQVTDLNAIKAIAANSAYGVALSGDGTIWLCDWAGWLTGPPWQWQWLKPLEQWSGFGEVVAVSTGSIGRGFHFEGHTLTLRGDGTVWAAGTNWSGELGDGTSATIRLAPVQVAGLSDIVSIAAGGGHNLALKQDGTVWAWGENFHGELGVEPNAYRTAPAPVIPPGSPDLAIRMSHDGDFTVGNPGFYTLTATNTGDTPISGEIIITDVLPPGLTYRSGNGTDWSCSAAQGVVTCTNPGPIDPGTPSTVTLTVDVGPKALPGITNIATAKNANDRNTSNNTIGDPTVVLRAWN